MMINPFVISFVLLIAIAVVGICIAEYVMRALALYSIAKNKNVNHAFLAWIPVGSSWILGRICDEYDGEKNERKHWALTLLIIDALVVLLSVGAYKIGTGSLATLLYGLYGESVSVAFLSGYVFSLILPSVLSNVIAILKHIATYKVFESIVPKKALKYIVISLLVPLGEEICLLITKKRLCEQMQQDEENSEYDEIYNEFAKENEEKIRLEEVSAENCENEEIAHDEIVAED